MNGLAMDVTIANPKLSNTQLPAAVGLSGRNLHRKIRQAMGLRQHELMFACASQLPPGRWQRHT
jgi:DNA-binding Xre family transcriptional regulator